MSCVHQQIKSLKAKIRSEELEPNRDPRYPVSRLYKKLDDLTILAANHNCEVNHEETCTIQNPLKKSIQKEHWRSQN